MKSEKTQFDLLCEQSVCNVWRKVAWAELREKFDQVGGKNSNEFLQSCIDVYRDRVDYSVENSIPVAKAFSVKLKELSEENRNFLGNEEDRPLHLPYLLLSPNTTRNPPLGKG